MTAVSALLNRNHASAETLPSITAKPMADSSGSTSNSSSDTGIIGANDFLTLLVTEMQNQDPTAATDPNEYINQLVNVNSLEQLISINQTLTSAVTPTSSTSGNNNGAKAEVSGATQTSLAAQKTAATGTHSATGLKTTAGNLAVPETSAAANRVASSLSGQSHGQISGVSR